MSESSETEAPSVPEAPRFGTFAGVFRPTVLTILGAMLYLREGWVVGNAGLFGAFVVILGAYTISGTTALSVASIATNTRVRPGGAFAIIAQSLGLEAGGAIGVPLYIAQTASAVMYLYAFTEAWGFVFPDMDPMLVALVAYLIVAGISWYSAQLAFKAQAVLLVVVALALTSMFGGLFVNDLHTPQLIGEFEQADLRTMFAIFFPACTGIMVGVGMSGSLADPRHAIPRGTLGAWGASLAVYLGGAVLYALVAAPAELISNKTIIMERSLIGPVVLVGLLVSTLTAALSSLVAAPRLLQAMGEFGILPWKKLAETDAGGEPKTAAAVTCLVAALGLSAGSLDAIAPVITAFFIVTYLAINLVVLFEQGLGMISFRPTFAIPIWVPLGGVIACAIGLLLATPSGGLIELLFVVGIYVWLAGRRLKTPWETVRSGVVANAAGWIARRTAGLEHSLRAWKPDLLVPVKDLDEARALAPLLSSLTAETGSVKLVGMGGDDEFVLGLSALADELREDGVYSTWSRLEEPSFSRAANFTMDALAGAFFPPNVVLLAAERHDQEELQSIVDHCADRRLGAVLYLPAPVGKDGRPRSFRPIRNLNVWLGDRSPEWALEMQMQNVDLPILAALLLRRAEGAPIRLMTVVRDPEQVAPGALFLQKLRSSGRLPPDTRSEALTGRFPEVLMTAARADLNLFGLSREIDRKRLMDIRDCAGAACLFFLDSGKESVLA